MSLPQPLLIGLEAQPPYVFLHFYPVRHSLLLPPCVSNMFFYKALSLSARGVCCAAAVREKTCTAPDSESPSSLLRHRFGRCLATVQVRGRGAAGDSLDNQKSKLTIFIQRLIAED